MFLSNVKEPYLVDRDGFEPPNPIGDVIYSHMVLTKLTHLSILKPVGGFEPPKSLRPTDYKSVALPTELYGQWSGRVGCAYLL